MASIQRLSAKRVTTVDQPGLYADGGGLYLQVTHGADRKPRRSWIYTAPDGRRREMGLGSARLVGLSAAREAALAARRQASSGVDPVDARLEARTEASAKQALTMTFRKCAEAYMTTYASSWKNVKHRWQWQNTLDVHVYPVFGDHLVDKVDVALVTRVLDPIWLTKTETATRVRGRIEAILDWASVRGYRAGENPARWRGHFQKALPNLKKAVRVRHYPALPFAETPDFMRKLEAQPGVSARALEFCILTAARTGETIHARWSEIDLEGRAWVVPAQRMKMGREHRVPLSTAARNVLENLAGTASDYVFPGQRPGRPLSNMALLMTLKGMGRPDLTTHGFRSTFRDWTAEQTDYPREVAEAALAHAIGDAVEAAYRRGDLFEKRRDLMESWSQYCRSGSFTSAPPSDSREERKSA